MLCPLLVPLDDPGAFAAAARCGASALVLDLGDADAPGDRRARRRAAAAALAGRGADAPPCIVRVAALRTGLLEDDLDAAMPQAPDLVMLPGAVGRPDVQHLAAKLAVREAEHGRGLVRTGIVAAAADTAAGVMALGSLSGAGPRLRALAWDPAALARGLGVGAAASPVAAARDLLLLAAAGAGVPALDFSVSLSVSGGSVAEACAVARKDGFGGRAVAHPGQVAATIRAFRR